MKTHLTLVQTTKELTSEQINRKILSSLRSSPTTIINIVSTFEKDNINESQVRMAIQKLIWRRKIGLNNKLELVTK